MQTYKELLKVYNKRGNGTFADILEKTLKGNAANKKLKSDLGCVF